MEEKIPVDLRKAGYGSAADGGGDPFGTDPRGSSYLHGSRTESDVGGAVLLFQKAAFLHHLRWVGDHGFRLPGGRGGADCEPRPAGSGYRRGRQYPDEYSGTGYSGHV